MSEAESPGTPSGRGMRGDPGDPVEPPSDRLADRLEARPEGADSPFVRALRELAEVDRAVYRAVAATPTPTIDRPLRALTSAADRSALWLCVAAALFVIGGRKGRRAALTGVAAIGATSAIVNVPLKLAGARLRPDRDTAGVPESRRVRMPMSSSFPSGHAASAAAFTAAVSHVVPVLGAPLGCASAAVGYTRVHSGVHYPGDVVVGALVRRIDRRGGRVGGGAARRASAMIGAYARASGRDGARSPAAICARNSIGCRRYPNGIASRKYTGMNSGPHAQNCRMCQRSWASSRPVTGSAETITNPTVIAVRCRRVASAGETSGHRRRSERRLVASAPGR